MILCPPAQQFPEGSVKVGTAEVVQERVDGRVAIGQPVGDVIQALGNQGPVDGHDVKRHVERHPTDQVTHNDVGQGQEYLLLATQCFDSGGIGLFIGGRNVLPSASGGGGCGLVQ